MNIEYKGRTFLLGKGLPPKQPPKTMEQYQQRVIEEKEALDEKRAALSKFMHGPVAAKLELSERADLQSQERIMTEYSQILGARIQRFYRTEKD